jgi:hypothetical protein
MTEEEGVGLHRAVGDDDLSPIRTVAVPDSTTKTCSRVTECGVDGALGLISTCQTAVSVAPVLGAASDVKRVPPRS